MLFTSESFNKLYEAQLERATNNAYTMDGSLAGLSFEKNESIIVNEGFIRPPANPQEHFIQRQVRVFFDKSEGINNSTIASHPDFKSLVISGVQKQYIATVFIDLKGSTRLSLVYPDLQIVYLFKNAVIQACIEAIRSFDGYVHRIMGDAVLGFFGSKAISKSQAVLDCMNCVSTLTVILNSMVKPWLEEYLPEFDSNDFGFRIGCNFGDDDDVLWGNYGYGETGEISPTGLSVDLASKLQGLAPKNNVMIGQGILEYLNFPEIFTSIKIVQKSGVDKEELFVTPNHTYPDGKSLNHMMRILNIDKYLLGSPLPIDFKKNYIKSVGYSEKILNNGLFNLDVEIINPNGKREKYISNTKIIKKGSKIYVSLKAKEILPLLKKYKVQFTKKNHKGFFNEPELLGMLEPEYDKNDIENNEMKGYSVMNSKVEFSRKCSYKGVHEIKCEVYSPNNSEAIFRDYVYVPIE